MKTLTMPASRWARARHFSSAAVLLFGFVACGAPANNAALFGSGGALTTSAGIGGAIEAAGAVSGGAGISGMSSGGALGDASAAGLGGGAAGMSDAGSAGTASGGVSGNSMGGSNSMGGNAPLTDCTAFGADATYYSETQHCYLVVHDIATFADAKTHCTSLGAHLVTLSNQDENHFVWSLDTNEHWIGTTDGKGPKETTPGTYTWVTGEPFTYTDWSAGQPNASKTSCGDANGGGDCYEHCGFQWSGGDVAGQWNDRYCLHTIEAICEWD